LLIPHEAIRMNELANKREKRAKPRSNGDGDVTSSPDAPIRTVTKKMNIRSVDSILQSVNLPAESLDFGGDYVVGNLSGFKMLMTKIEDLPLFKGPREMLLGSSIYTTSGDSIKVQDSEYNAIYLMHSNVVNGITAFLDFFKDLLPPEDDDSVTIKIPDPVDFNEAVEFQSDVLIAISQNVVNPKIGGKVILKAWEPGSFRLTLDLGSNLAVGLVGGMASAAAKALKKHQEGKTFESMVKGLDVKTEAIQEVLRGLQVYVNLLLGIEAKKLVTKSFGDATNTEQEARLLHGIKLFMGLIEKGAEFQPSLQASASVKEAFPDFSQLSLT
jgi:hypothetical protein